MITVTKGNKIENNRLASNYRHYRFILIRKQCGRRKITVITGVTVVTVSIINGIDRIMVGCSRCTYPSIHLSSQDHGRLPDKHSFFHCAETLKITVGCPTKTYPSVRTKNAR